MQMFTRNPRQWRDNFLDPADIEEFDKRQKKYNIKPIFIHIPYLANLASPNLRLYEASVDAYIEDVLEADALKTDYIVTHMGSHKKTSEESGIERLIRALNRILEKTRNSRVGILLENTAGSGSWLGYKFAHHRNIIQGLNQKERIGLCLDTAHAYLAGYDISTPKGLEEMLDEIEGSVGINLVKLIHLNDAKNKLGSRHDRHEHIGRGRIGLEGIRRVVNHPRLKDCPFILETPKVTERDDMKNLNTVRAMRDDAGISF
jgi:deoxyribonuclease-4